MPIDAQELKFTVKPDGSMLRRYLDEQIAQGNIRIDLICGAEVAPHAVHATQFTLDKTKYRLRLSDETETSVKVWIEAIPQGRCNHTPLPGLPKASQCTRCGM